MKSRRIDDEVSFACFKGGVGCSSSLDFRPDLLYASCLISFWLSIGSSLGLFELLENGLIERSSAAFPQGVSRPFNEASPLVVRVFIPR